MPAVLASSKGGSAEVEVDYDLARSWFLVSSLRAWFWAPFRSLPGLGIERFAQRLWPPLSLLKERKRACLHLLALGLSKKVWSFTPRAMADGKRASGSKGCDIPACGGLFRKSGKK